MTWVLDASALLAFLHDETGAERVRAALKGALICSVNWAEVVQKTLKYGAEVKGMRNEFIEIGTRIEPFTWTQAELAAQLWETTHRYGLSLADRACLALAIEHQSPVMTADRTWSRLDLAVDIRLVR